MPDGTMNGLALAEFLVEEEDLEASTRGVVQSDLPVLLVGLGGVGTCAVAHLLRRVGGLERNPNISAICIDTTSLTDHETRGRMPWIRSVLTEGSTFVSLTDSNQFAGGLPLRAWRAGQMNRDTYEAQFGWYRGVNIPDALQQFGAGAIRQVGRLVFARAVQDGWLRAAVTSAMSKLTNARPGGTVMEGDNAGALVTIVVAGTAGGTGSGMFLDTVALLHEIRHTMTVHQLYVRGLLAAPTIFLRCNQRKERLAENAYAFFKELDYALKADSKTLGDLVLPRSLITMPDDMDGKAFMSNVYVVDDKVPGTRNVGSVAELHAVMGQALYALTASVAGGAFEASDTVNGAGTTSGRGGHRAAYATIGSSRALVPVDSLATLCAEHLIIDVVNEVLLDRPESLEATLDKDFDKKGSLTAVYDTLDAPIREMEKAAQRLTARITASANAVDSAGLAEDKEFVVGLRRTRDQLNRQKTEGLDVLRRELADIKLRGIVAADGIFRDFVNGCDQGLVYAEEAIKRIDVRLESDLSTMRMQIKNLRPKPDPNTGIVHSRSTEIGEAAERAARSLVAAALGRIRPGSGNRQLAEDFVKAVSEEISNEVRLTLLESQANYVAAIAAAALLEGPAKNDVAVEATERAEVVVRRAKMALRARAEDYQARVRTFKIQQSEGGISVTTEVYPREIRAGLSDGEKLRDWYEKSVRKAGETDKLDELSRELLARLRNGDFALYSWGLADDASAKRARTQLLSAAVEVVRPMVAANLPDSVFTATGGTPADTIRDLVMMAAPTIEANTPEAPTQSSTACVSEPEVVGPERKVDNTDIVAGGTVHEALALRCVHGHVLEDFARVGEWRKKYQDYIARPEGEGAIPIHINDGFVRLPEPVSIKMEEMPDEVFESFLFAMLATELTRSTFPDTVPREIKLRITGDETRPVDKLADLPDLVRLDPDPEKGWTLAVLDRDESREWVVFDRSAAFTVLGPSMSEVIGNLAALPAARRDCMREVYRALLSLSDNGGETTLVAMRNVRANVLKRLEKEDTDRQRQVWQRIAKELGEEINYCEQRW